MLKLKCVGSGSTGNSFLLFYGEDVLIIDCGLPIGEIKKALQYNILGIRAVVCTHGHDDHSRSIKDFRRMHIPVFTPYEDAEKKPVKKQFGPFKITAIPLLDRVMEHWQHTNGDGSECVCYAFLIEVDNQRILYVTDTKFLVWNLAKWEINHMLIGLNYIPENLSSDEFKTRHVVSGHLSLNAASKIVKVNATDALENVILFHMGQKSTDKGKCITEIKNNAKKANVTVAQKDSVWTLYGHNECPF